MSFKMQTSRCDLADLGEKSGEECVTRQLAFIVALTSLDNSDKIIPVGQWRCGRLMDRHSSLLDGLSCTHGAFWLHVGCVMSSGGKS